MLARTTLGVALALASIVALASAPPSADATTLIKKDLKQLVVESDLVVDGVVVAQRSEWLPGTKLIYTHTTLRVLDVLKGTAGSRVVVSELGGTVGDVTCRVPGTPSYRKGERAIITLKRDALGLWRTHGLIQGRFQVVHNRATDEDLVLVNRGLEHVTRSFFAADDVSPRGAIERELFRTKIIELARPRDAGKEGK